MHGKAGQQAGDKVERESAYLAAKNLDREAVFSLAYG